jgi:putative nucleotidyltransferase with HDIG domain
MGPEIVQSGLLALLELELPETYGHARRVARASVAMARAMSLPEAEVRAIQCAALLHDIGKIAIPARLLRHRGPLGEYEIAALRMHVTIGAELASGIPSPRGVSPLIAATHERYDGTGYPNRLAGDDIPVGARIIAVADSHDAMLAPRPYCEALTRDEAHNEMVRCSGSHFDPAIVREWMALMGTWGCPVTVMRPRISRFDRSSAIPVRAQP